MSTPLLFFLFFAILAAALVATALGLNLLEASRKKTVKNVLRTVEGESHAPETTILVNRADRDKGFERMAADFRFAGPLHAQLLQAGLNWTIGQFLLLTLVGCAVGFAVGCRLPFLVFRTPSVIACAVAGGVLPILYIAFKKHKRLTAFEEQFPEALDFLARSMRAGHAFSISLEMLGTESPEPLGQEFRALFNEQNLGAPLADAFGNMLRRLPLVDVRFFVSSVMLQKQTGGNLSEILGRLAFVIRERFRLRGQVRAASAHGRLTAGILTTMPIALMFALLYIAPGYLQGMAKDADGKWLIMAAVVAQLLGYYFVRRIIRIKV
jgi:tight adherence protein B